MKLLEFLKSNHASEDFVEWLECNDYNIQEVINNIDRGDWLLRMAYVLGCDKRLITLANARCAETIIHLMLDDRSIQGVKSAIAFGNGEITEEDLDINYFSAYKASISCNDNNYDILTCNAATSACRVPNTYDSDFHEDIEEVPICTAYACAGDADFDNKYTAKKQNQKQTAHICKELLGDFIIKKLKELGIE